MTLETLLYLRSLVDRVTLQVADPNFRTDAHAIMAAIDELDAAIRDNGRED